MKRWMIVATMGLAFGVPLVSSPRTADAFGFPGKHWIRKGWKGIERGTKNAAGQIWNGTKWVSKKIWDAENKGQGRG